MMTDGVKITLLDDKELDLVLNTEAMAELCDEFGDLEKIGDKLNNASYSEKIRLVPRLISILATQGEAIKGNNTNISPDYILRQTLPKDIPAMTGAFLRAIESGMNIKYTMEDSETDAGRSENLTPLRVVHYGLTAGLDFQTIMKSNPGAVLTLYLYRRDYDDQQHGITREKGAAFYADA